MRSQILYCGTSVRAEHGVQKGLPVFGRFAARVEEQSIRISQDEESGEYYISLPYGSTWGGEGTQEWADESFEGYVAGCTPGPNRNGWTTDRAVAERIAIEHAKARHEKKMAESAGYAAQFGGK